MSKNRIARLACKTRWLIRCGLVLMALAAGGFVWFATTVAELRARPMAQADGIVVLTGGQHRIAAAIDLLARGKAQRLLITGVNETTTLAALGRIAPRHKRLFQCCIDLDRRARDTFENAQEANAWATRNGFRSLILVTSSYHIPRSLKEFRLVLSDLDLQTYPVASEAFRTDPWWVYPGTMRILIVEYGKFLAASGRLWLTRWFGRHPDLPSRPEHHEPFTVSRS